MFFKSSTEIYVLKIDGAVTYIVCRYLLKLLGLNVLVIPYYLNIKFIILLCSSECLGWRLASFAFEKHWQSLGVYLCVAFIFT